MTNPDRACRQFERHQIPFTGSARSSGSLVPGENWTYIGTKEYSLAGETNQDGGEYKPNREPPK